MEKTLYSIIIPVYNGALTLSLLLKSIGDIEFNKDQFEITLIDNNSNDQSSNIIKNFISENHKLKVQYLFFDKVQSSYAARNYGVKHSKGDILIFTDSDCRFDSKYLKKLDQYVKTSNCHYILLGGRIVFNIQDPKNLWEVYDSISSLQNKTNANNNKSVTANLVCSIDVFRTVGEFNENTSGGDFEWTKRTLDFGFKLKYNDNITIYHPTRKTFREIKRKYYRFGLGWGEEIAESKKNSQLSKFYYFLRIFYFPTNIRYSAILFTKLGLVKTILFNIYFFQLRYNIFRGVKKGIARKRIHVSSYIFKNETK